MREQPLLEHLIELRSRLIYCVAFFLVASGFSYFFAEHIFEFLVRPLSNALKNSPQHRLIYTSLPEAFLTYVKVSLFSGAFITFPFLAVQVWKFIAPGLYKNEQNTFIKFLIATPFLFLLGAVFAYYFIIPNAWNFFLQFETPASATALPIQLEARISEYLSMTLQLLFAFGICFQLPLVLVLLAQIGIVSADLLSKSRRYAILIILIVSAILTPPDVLSMIGLAVPLCILYELAIYLVKWTQKTTST